MRDNGSIRTLKTGAGTLLDPKFAPDGRHVAYVLDYDLYVYDLQKNEERQRKTGMVQSQFLRPGVSRMLRAEVHERNC